MTMIDFLVHVLKLFGVVYLRFSPIPRLWCVWLVAVNAACLLFITHIEAQTVLAVTIIAVGDSPFHMGANVCLVRHTP
jgi:hypothetical protein